MLAKTPFSKISKTISLFVLFSFMLTNAVVGQTLTGSKNNSTKQLSSRELPSLTKYTTDLTALARDGRISVNPNFEREADLLVKSLTDGDLRQLVILDETSENQEVVVKVLASRLVKGDVPALSGKRVLKLELDTFFADVKDNTEAARRVDELVGNLEQAKDEVILFVNELTNFVGTSQISGKLTEALLNSRVHIIGGSSKAAFAEKIGSNAEIAAIFETIEIGKANFGSPEEELRKQILNNEGFRGDRVASDLREMMQNDSTGGKKRVDVIL